MLEEIKRNLEEQLTAGVTTEVQVVYLMVGIRKILEQTQTKDRYPNLSFHCNWAVHSRLSRRDAQSILRQFDAANIYLKNGIALNELPAGLRAEIVRISKMESLETELSRFLKDNDLPSLDNRCPDGWGRFLHLYACVIQDSPLEVKGPKASTISKVVVRAEMANEPAGHDMFFRVRWIIHDRNGLTGEVFVLNSFSSNS